MDMKSRIPITVSEQSAGEEPAEEGVCGFAFLESAGINGQEGLVLTGGTGEGYRKTLIFFAKDALARMPLLETVPAPEGLQDFTIFVHGLKSAAATIGAERLSKAALELESAARRGDLGMLAGTLPAFRENLLKAAECILEGFKAGLGKPVRGPASEAPPLPEEQLAALKTALGRRDIENIDRLMGELEETVSSGECSPELKTALENISGHVLMAEFAEAVMDIDALLPTSSAGTP